MLGGRLFDSPGTQRTHPMSDKMRGALFNILGELTGLSILDAFGGSGALAYEAVSRGAASVLILEQDIHAQRTIKHNLRLLDIGSSATLVRTSAGDWLTTNEGRQFDVVLCDPPYNELQPNLLARLAERANPGGIFVLSYPAGQPKPEFKSLMFIRQQTYGSAQLLFYRA